MPGIPPDFPRPVALGSVTGAQPKVLAVRVGRRFLPNPEVEGVEARHQLCEDLVQQLVRYSARKRVERPDWTPVQVREKVAQSVRQKAFGWGLSPAEAEWVVRHFAALDGAALPGGSTTS